jgi:hypothetical protein
MIGVTIGIGEGWDEVAREARRRMELMTGLKCQVLGEEFVDLVNVLFHQKAVHPSWLKCFVASMFPEEQEFLVFDADVICVRPWDPNALFKMMGRRFCAVAEENRVTVLVECANFRLPFPDWYVNGGLLMFGQEHAPVWDAVWARHPQYGSWLEQTALNEALRSEEVVRLPRIYNSMLHGVIEDGHRAIAQGAVNLHADSMGGRAAEVLKAQMMF